MHLVLDPLTKIRKKLTITAVVMIPIYSFGIYYYILLYLFIVQYPMYIYNTSSVD